MGKAPRISGGGGGGGNGIMGSGVFGMFGSTVVCKAEDDSTYCLIIKMFNLLMIAFVVVSVLYLLYYIFTVWRRASGTLSRSSGKK